MGHFLEDFALGEAGIVDSIFGTHTAARVYQNFEGVDDQTEQRLEDNESSILQQAQEKTANQLTPNLPNIDLSTLVEFAIILLAVGYGLYVVTVLPIPR